MHKIQDKIIKLARSQDISRLSLREVGKLIGEVNPSAQKIKHHIDQLKKKGLIEVNPSGGIFLDIKRSIAYLGDLIDLPIVGYANCGPATFIGEESVVSFLKVSPRMVKKIKDTYVLIAKGNSMNRSNIEGKNINDGDYVIVDSSLKNPQQGDYVVSIIDGCANIKRFTRDQDKNIVLVSESSHEFPPIYIHEQDYKQYLISGKVIQVIKRPHVLSINGRGDDVDD